jgi:hypothetical protein
LEELYGKDYLHPVRRHTPPKVKLPLEMCTIGEFEYVDMGLVYEIMTRPHRIAPHPIRYYVAELKVRTKIVCSQAYVEGFLDWIQQAEGCENEE